jgi:hypothetical protein
MLQSQLGAMPFVGLALTAGVIAIVPFILRFVIHYRKLAKFPVVSSLYFSGCKVKSRFIQSADELLRHGFSKVSHYSICYM